MVMLKQIGPQVTWFCCECDTYMEKGVCQKSECSHYTCKECTMESNVGDDVEWTCCRCDSSMTDGVCDDSGCEHLTCEWCEWEMVHSEDSDADEDSDDGSDEWSDENPYSAGWLRTEQIDVDSGRREIDWEPIHAERERLAAIPA
ncbi:predicted protein [Aspergillus terreus NIH2624]|uniref:Uncharacterized protein n=1 Tax=Aspergillus terreus (strain NIH 2624 / FGSC A1156) TaxID=341663 RepID=Q0CFA8_ASPTN|nr:uncharacterized protein ATEG_07626 [Aspergillus terreus NIH2624]EAU31888.1 predicted protein [Aspergillus terreus NIH2624]